MGEEAPMDDDETTNERRTMRVMAQAIERELTHWKQQVATPRSGEMPAGTDPAVVGAGPMEAEPDLTASAARRALGFVRDQDGARYALAGLFADAGQLEMVVERLDRAGLLEARQKAEEELVRVRGEIQKADADLLDRDRGGDDARQRIGEIAALMREASSDEPPVMRA
jgi:hypothetical protein